MSKLKSNKQLINTRYHKNIYRKILLIIAKIQQKSVLIDMCGMCLIIIPRVSSVVLYDKSKKLYHQRVVVIFLLCFFFLISTRFDTYKREFWWMPVPFLLRWKRKSLKVHWLHTPYTLTHNTSLCYSFDFCVTFVYSSRQNQARVCLVCARKT